jgi:hypothetical protein
MKETLAQGFTILEQEISLNMKIDLIYQGL